MKLNGKLFLELLQLDRENVTAEEVRDALIDLTEMQLLALFEVCTIKEDCPVLQIVAHEEDIFTPYTDDYRPMSHSDAKRRLKYERNYLVRKELNKCLLPDFYSDGKHSKGCKRKYRRR